MEKTPLALDGSADHSIFFLVADMGNVGGPPLINDLLHSEIRDHIPCIGGSGERLQDSHAK